MPLSKARNRERMRQLRYNRRLVEPKKERHIRLPFRIYKRDGFTCQYCGRTPGDGVRLELDHIQPVSLGGNGDDANLITACWECNNSKSNVPLVVPKVEEKHQAIPIMADCGIQGLDADGQPIYEES